MNKPVGRSGDIAVLEAVDRIGRSGALGGGERLPALLAFIVEEELSGRGDRIKGFTIATEALGRGPDFDSQNDGIARAEMGRLRRALDHYYASEGRADPVRISIPKGSYRPSIEFGAVIEPTMRLEQATVAPSLARKAQIAALLVGLLIAALIAFAAIRTSGQGQNARPSTANPASLAILPIAVAPDTSENHALASALTAAIAARLAELPWLTVVLQHGQTPPDGYALSIRLDVIEQTYAARAFLTHGRGAEIRWSSEFGRGPVGGLRRLVDTLGSGIAEAVGGDGGALARDLAVQGDADELDERFTCLLLARRYWHSFIREDRRQAEACLAPLVARSPAFMEGRAALALFAVEDARTLRGAAREAALGRARETLPPPVEPTPLLVTARLALAACERDVGAARSYAARLLERFPNDPATLADVGSKLAVAVGDIRAALDAETRAMTLNPRPDPWYPLGTIHNAIVSGEPARALTLIGQVPPRGFALGHALALAAGVALGDPVVVRAERAGLARLGYPSDDAIRALIEGQCWSDEAIAPILRLIDRAGAVAP